MGRSAGAETLVLFRPCLLAGSTSYGSAQSGLYFRLPRFEAERNNLVIQAKNIPDTYAGERFLLQADQKSCSFGTKSNPVRVDDRGVNRSKPTRFDTCRFRMMDRLVIPFLVSVLLMSLLAENVGPALADYSKCSACRAVAEELEAGLANERPRNHIDLRHRLDSKGQREGKVIDYKVSELRVVELLDGLCAKFKDYTYNKKEGGGMWMKVLDGNLLGLDRQAAERHSKELISYCGRLLETTEDELASKIQKGEAKVGEVENVLCRELTKHCKQPKVLDIKQEEADQEEDSSIGILESSDGEL